MNNLLFFFFFSLLLFSCQTQTENPLVAKYHIEYEAIKSQTMAQKSDIIRLVKQLPPNYQNAIQQGITAIEQYDLSEFLQKEKMNEEGLSLLFQSIRQFLEDIEKTKNFKATANQTEMYNLFKKRLLENKKSIDPFIAACEKSNNPDQLNSGIFLKKVMQYDIHQFVQNTFIGTNEFENTFSEVNQNWDEFITNVMMINMETELLRK